MTEPDKIQSLARLVAERWNHLAKSHGWPQRLDPENIARKSRLITRVGKGFECCEKLTQCPPQAGLLDWILARWNWNKNPAPIGILESQDNWKALELTLQRSEEESRESHKETLDKITTWTEKEFAFKLREGKTPEQCQKEIEEFALATGRTKAWSIQEKLHFCHLTEELKEKHSQMGNKHP